MFFVYLIVALAAGVALATQSAINTQLAKAMSGEAVIATFISFAVGTIFLFFIHLMPPSGSFSSMKCYKPD